MSPGTRRVLLSLAALLGLLAWRSETRLGEVGWRQIQAEYLDGVLETSRARLAVLRAESAENVRFLEGEVAVAQDEAAARGVEASDARRRLLALERKLRSVESRLRAAESPSEERETARREAEGLREQVAIQREILDDVERGVAAAQAELAAARAPMEALEEKVDTLDGFRGWLRRVPVLRAWGAGIGVRSIEVVEAGPAGVDLCVTCHLAMAPVSLAPVSLAPVSKAPVSEAPVSEASERPLDPELETPELATQVGEVAEGWGRLFAPHPASDLHVAPGSPHPADRFGCVACHGGNGRATGFAEAGHVPRDEETEERWRRQWGWRPPAPSQAPLTLHAGRRVESSCVACHDAPWLRGAPTQEAGRLLVRAMGCAACHETGRPDLVPSAPSLVDLPARKRPEWVATFLADPSAWKPTFMPHFWSAEVPRDERDAEVAAVVAWLWRWGGGQPRAEGGVEAPESETETETVTATVPLAVDEELDELAAAGRRTWRQMACSACHVVEPSTERSALLGSQRLRGPSLARLAAEVSPGALEALLVNHEPRFAWRRGEVEELAAYLAAQGDSDLQADLESDPAIRDRVLRRRLLEVTTYEATDARMKGASSVERQLLLGELAVRRFRCGACHRLPEAARVFSDDDPGADSGGAEASAPLLANFGETADGGDSILDGSWVHGEARTGAADLPSWRLAPAEAEALAVQLAGWRRPPHHPARLDSSARAGRDVVARVGCRACHDLDGRPPATVFDRRVAPPSLARAGEKLRSEWIFEHLDEPSATSLRTDLPAWNGLRMPRFELSGRQRSQVAEYFAARAGSAMLTPRIEAASSAERALGAAVYQVLLCDRCHTGGDSETDFDGADGPGSGMDSGSVSAPSYAQSGQRLRPSWLRAWLLAPHAWEEDSEMPAPFPLRAGEPDATYLLAALDAPMFTVQSQRLERFYAGRGELEAAFEDPEKVADALAAYVLTLGGAP